MSNEWIPTESVRAIQKIKQMFGGQMTETCISQILYELNSIWREIMRKENDAIKRKLTGQIQDLRRQLVTKRAFDEEDAQKEISRLKKELKFAQKINGKKSQGGQNENYVNKVSSDDRAAFQRKVLEESQLNVKNRINELEQRKQNKREAYLVRNDIPDDQSSSKFGGRGQHNNQAY